MYQERGKGLGQRGVFLQTDAKSSTGTCLGGRGVTAARVLTVHFACVSAGAPMHAGM